MLFVFLAVLFTTVVVTGPLQKVDQGKQDPGKKIERPVKQ